jgi:1,4-dihydroxy-2-naphthoyl-CoA hydrolase
MTAFQTTPLSKAARKRLAERLRRSNPSQHFGFQLAEAERGHVVICMAVREHHQQMQGAVHGGVLASLADTAGGLAAFVTVPPGARVVTVEMKINFLESVERGTLSAEGRVIRQGKHLIIVDCDITDDQGRLVAKALMTLAILPPRPGAPKHGDAVRRRNRRSG